MRSFLFLFLAVSEAILCGQQPGMATLHTTTRLVQMNVLVHDSKGAPVIDLTRDDFVVLDEGKPVRLVTFQMVAQTPAAHGGPAAHSLKLFNKSPALTDKPAAATVILIDSLNMQSADDLRYVKRELPKFLKNLNAGDPVAIYSLAGPAVRVIHEFSEDSDSLVESSGKGPGTVSKWLESTGGLGTRGGTQHIRTEWTLGALETIALHLGDIPGRKTLVWVSSAFPITAGFIHAEALAKGASTKGAKNGDMEAYRDRLTRLARILNNVDVAVYPVDPRGLSVDSQYKASANKPASRNSTRLVTKGEDTAGEFATMDLLAAETGGRAYYNANALGESIQRAVDDSRYTYVLGFYPDEATWDGRSHRLEVQVTRHGLEVRSRRSYFASDPESETPTEREDALQLVAATPLNGTAIGVTVKVNANPLEPGSQQIDISVAPQDISFVEKDGKWRADFDLLLTQQGPDGRRLAGERSQVLLDRDSYSDSQNKAITFRRNIDVQEDAVSLRVLVRDALNGAVGSLDVPIASSASGAKAGR